MADLEPVGSRSSLVIGGDLGGTSTRVLLSDLSGRPLARGTAGGGNPTTHPDRAAGELGRALAEALHGVDPARVTSAVIGTAGGHAEVGDHFRQVWAAAGVAVEPRYVSDAVVAFASGTPEPDGVVLIVGTGTAAVVVVDHEVVRTADGYGWLLGDEGSGFWMGREAVRATLMALDSAEPGVHGLGEAVLAAVLGRRVPGGSVGPRDAAALRGAAIGAVNGRPPVRLAELAPLVSAAFDVGDPAAVDIVHRAAERLADTVGQVRGDVPAGAPLVISGSVGGPGSPVGRRLRELLAAGDDAPSDVRTVGDGLPGAAWLALRALGPAHATEDTHRRLAAG